MEFHDLEGALEIIPTASSFYTWGAGCPEWLRGLSKVILNKLLSTLLEGGEGCCSGGYSQSSSLLSWPPLIIPGCRPMSFCLSLHLAPSQWSTPSGVPPASGMGGMALLQQSRLTTAPWCLRATQKTYTSRLPLSDPAELPNLVDVMWPLS